MFLGALFDYTQELATGGIFLPCSQKYRDRKLKKTQHNILDLLKSLYIYIYDVKHILTIETLGNRKNFEPCKENY